jgi:hypothetical protein
MGLVSNTVRDHSEKELADLRAERLDLLRKAAEISREIAAGECHEILGQEYAAAEGKSNGKPVEPKPVAGRGAARQTEGG